MKNFSYNFFNCNKLFKYKVVNNHGINAIELKKKRLKLISNKEDINYRIPV